MEQLLTNGQDEDEDEEEKQQEDEEEERGDEEEEHEDADEKKNCLNLVAYFCFDFMILSIRRSSSRSVWKTALLLLHDGTGHLKLGLWDRSMSIPS